MGATVAAVRLTRVSTSVPAAVLLRFDGIVHTSDLPTQAFARHLAEALPTELNATLIGGMRGFLEGKPELLPAGIDLTVAEDGEQAVEILARAAGLAQPVIETARRAARRDFASSVWAVERAEGLDELLTAAAGTHLAVVAEPDDPAAAGLLESEEITVDELILGPVTVAIEQLRNRVDGGQLVMVGTRWAGELSAAGEAGCVTVLVDRRGAGRGAPTIRCDNLVDAAAAVTARADA